MRAQILHIGVLDKQGKVHSVTFHEGVNVVTGRSSTGKSALVEIFDYCFGSSDFTVPVGVITESAALYFTVMKLNQSALVLARRPNDSHAFLKEELNIDHVKRVDALSAGYFEDDYFSPLGSFLKELGRHFGLVVTDVDVDLVARGWNGRKSATPSVRSFTSYILQHQNLVANKHAIFYRFDEKEKREQAIDHLKIFLGFADQLYFVKAQELNALKHELRSIKRGLPRHKDRIEEAKKRLVDALQEYEAMSGAALSLDVDTAVSRPKTTLQALRASKVDVRAESDAHVRLRQEAEKERRELVSQLRRKQQELAFVESSIEYSRRYVEKGIEVVIPERAELHASTCPFCGSQNSSIEEQANELSEAINWLNSELSRSSYRLSSFEEEKRKVQSEIDEVKPHLKRLDRRIQAFEQQIEDLEKVRSQYELAVEAKIRVETVLSELAHLKDGQSDADLENLRGRIRELEAFLKANYDIDRKLANAQHRIQDLLAQLGGCFDFEKSYTPIRLRFSLESFDLWHEAEDGKRVFLRTMGSGANWLSCHLVLFLALHRYFCEVGQSCSIPSVLFFDQPSQVYFPSILDGGTEFSAEELARKDSSRDQSRPVDEDLKAVTNIFAQLVIYCNETAEATGIMPQIIITDHADHLELPGNVRFESLVRKRWRQDGDGLIDLSSNDGHKAW